MNFMKRILSIIFVLAVAAVGVFFAVGCELKDKPVQTPPIVPSEPEKPLPSPEPKPDPKPEPDPEPTAAEAVKKIYDATAPNFSASVVIRQTDGNSLTEKKLTVIYDKNEGGSFSDGQDEFICTDGLLFERVGEIKIKDDEGEKTASAYSAKSGTLGKLTAVIDDVNRFLEPIAEKFGDGLILVAGEKEIKLECTLSHGATIDKIFAALKRNTDKPIARLAAELIKEFENRELTDEEAAAIVIHYGNMTLEKLMAEGGEMFEFGIRAAYFAIGAALGGYVELMPFEDFMNSYGKITLKEFLGAKDGEDFISIVSERALSESLKRVPFMQGTLLSLFTSNAETSFEKANISVSLTADKSFELISARFAADIFIEKLPTFLPSLDESGIREEIVDVKRSFVAEAAFTDVGKSKANPPEYFSYEGEQTIEVVCGGEYSFHAGELNTFDEDADLVLEVESGAIGDPAHWSEVMTKIHEGTEIDRKAKKLNISRTAYKSLVEAKKLGLTRIAIPAYKEFTFVLDIR